MHGPGRTQTILLAGATGLVGADVLKGLLGHPQVGRVHVLTRRALPFEHKKLREHLIDFRAVRDWQAPESIDVGCSCLGTTLRSAGSREAFRAIDEEAVLALADLTLAAGGTRFLAVSSIGASSQSRAFYSRVKGDVEEALTMRTGTHGFSSMVLFQPSLLTGHRQAFRSGERFADWLSRPLAPLMRGPLAVYRPIPATVVARAVVSLAMAPPNEALGVVRVTGPAMRQLARSMP